MDWDDSDEVDYSLREIPLPEGRVHIVSRQNHPLLMEWDWKYCPINKQPVRTDGSRTITLYDEEMGLHVRRAGVAIHRRPRLQRGTVRALFGHLPEFRDMVMLSQKQREFAQYELSCQLPTVHDVLALGVSEGVARYLDWKARGQRFEVKIDPERLTPPAVLPLPAAELPTYSTLGEWMDGEWTGGFVKDPRTPTGLAPERQGHRVEREFRKLWRLEMRQYLWHTEDDDEKQTPRAVERALKEADRPVWLLLRHAADCVREYPLT